MIRAATRCSARVGRARDADPPDYSLLRDYQCTGVDALRANPHFLLADEMRLGKTAQALRALRRLTRSIVMCPASVMGVWCREVARWRPDLSAVRSRELRRPNPREVLVLSWGSLPERPLGTDHLVLDDLSDVQLIGDEIHYVMSHKAERTQAWRALRRQCGSCWGLSATPMPGEPRQLWGVLVSLGISHVFRDDDEFIELCGGEAKMIRKNGRMVQVGMRWGNVSPEVRERVSRVMLRRLARDYVSLPRHIPQDVPCPIPPDLREFLDTEQRGAWTDVDQDELPPFELLAPARKALARSRIEQALDFATTATGESPIVVFSAHVEPVRAFEAVKGAGWVAGTGASHGTREETIELFRSGRLRILAMTIQTGGVGLDLSRADGILFVDLPYTPGELAQAEARADRVDKSSPVSIWTMTSDHPLECRVRDILREKRRLREAVGV